MHWSLALSPRGLMNRHFPSTHSKLSCNSHVPPRREILPRKAHMSCWAELQWWRGQGDAWVPWLITSSLLRILTWWKRVQAVVIVARVIDHCWKVPVLGTTQHLATEEHLLRIRRLVPPRSRLILKAVPRPSLRWTEINCHPFHGFRKLHAPLDAIIVLPADYGHVGALAVSKGSVNVLVPVP